jgi:predicted Zn-dependent protease with MMP-like domain
MPRRLADVVSVQRFQELVREAVDALPDWVLERLENVEIMVEDDAPDGSRTLLGHYEGIPLTRRGPSYGGVLPDRIELYRHNIERAAGADERSLRETISHTVAHEVAHLFGISDDRLREIDRY